MPHNISHFAIHADDVERAREFYETVFGWRFDSWGPPGFYMIRTGPAEAPGIHGSLQQRRSAMTGEGVGFECTVSVDDLDAIMASIERHGGTLAGKKVTIDGVGVVVSFRDTEGNVACAMQYEGDHRWDPDAA